MVAATHRILKHELKKFKRALIHPTFIFVTVVGNSVLVLATILVHWLEKDVNPRMNSYFDSLWWGVSTITSVGYGDIVPITLAGKIIGLLLMYGGTLLFVIFAGILVTCWMSEEVEREISPLEAEVKAEAREQRHIEATLKGVEDRLRQLEDALSFPPLKKGGRGDL